MNRKLKLGMGIAGFILMIVIAVVAYNALRGRVSPLDNFSRIEEQIQEGSRENQEELRAPDFAMIDRDGNELRLSTLIANGKPIVLNFWASWCPPCVIEMPDFDRVYRDIGDEVQFVMLNLVDGQRETVAIGTNFIVEHGFSFPVFFDTRREGAIAYGIRSIPTTLFIDRSGYIVTGVQGMIDENTLRRGIALLQ